MVKFSPKKDKKIIEFQNKPKIRHNQFIFSEFQKRKKNENRKKSRREEMTKLYALYIVFTY